MNPLNVDKVYVAHYEPLTERKNRLSDTIDFDVEWVTAEPSNDEVKTLYNDDPKSWKEKCPYFPYRRLKRSDISLVFKHYKIYQDIVANQYKRVLVFEDDIVIDDNFHTFNKVIDSVNDWDFIFLGQCCGLRIREDLREPNKFLYKVGYPATKCTDSYCVSLIAAEKILTTMIPFVFPIDFELNYQIDLHNLDSYWCEPPLMKISGSESGEFNTTKNND